MATISTWNAPLRDDGSTIVLIVNQMDRHAALLRAGGDNRLVNPCPVHAFAPECREKRWMNVDDSRGIFMDHGGRNSLQVSGQHHKVDAELAKQLEELGPIVAGLEARDVD